ncbi:MAG: DUF2269 domain-containing protein [Archangiaceae bacterium]|nr:DUF2269 domain-containing protein [Archangiaceae bacterium]
MPPMILLVKALHVLSATIFFGAGLMSAFWKFRGDQSGDPRVVDWAQKQVVLADWVFTVPSGVISPLTGAYLASVYGLPWTTPWVLASLGGYLGAMVLWLPAAWIQIELRKMTKAALESGGTLPERFHRLNRVWLLLGVPAFGVSVFIIFAMVAKPTLWGS